MTAVGPSGRYAPMGLQRRGVPPLPEPEDEIDDDYTILSAEVGPAASLKVLVFGARHLLAKDLFGKSDPYVKIKLLNEAGETLEKKKGKPAKRTLDPVFGTEVFSEWRFANTFSKLVIQIRNKNLTRTDDFLGQVEFAVEELRDHEMKGWLRLQPRQGQTEKVSGEVKVHVLYTAPSGEAGAGSRTTVQKAMPDGGPQLFVTVVEGKNINAWPNGTRPKNPNEPSFNASNPYCMVSFGAQTVRSPTLKRTFHPKWCFQHNFRLADTVSQGVDSTGVLKVQVMHWDRFSITRRDKHVGTVSIPLSDFHPTITVDKWYQLEGGQGKDAHVRLLVKHHDSRKMASHVTRTIALVMTVVLVAVLTELVFQLVFPPGVGLLVGGLAGSLIPRRLWDLYKLSFDLWPYFSPLEARESAPSTHKSLRGRKASSASNGGESPRASARQ